MVWQNRLYTCLGVNMAEGQGGGSSFSAPICSRCLTSSIAAVGIHEGVGHPLILLESALLCHAAV